MALRRLMSGWLIALASLARSVALALERAAERSAPVVEPAVDPVMAALVERYPDAPAHWLAYMAERMPQAADVVEVASPDLARPATASRQDLATAPAARPPPPRPSPTVGREPAAIPSLAELASRSSEVWRRPGALPKRPSRPVFARPTGAPPSNAATAREGDPTPPPPCRPRSPLTLVARAPSEAPTDRLSPETASTAGPALDVARPPTAPTQAGPAQAAPQAFQGPTAQGKVAPARAASAFAAPTPIARSNPAPAEAPPPPEGRIEGRPAPDGVTIASATPRTRIVSLPPVPPPADGGRFHIEPRARATPPRPRDSGVIEAGAPGGSTSRSPLPGPLAAARSAARRVMVRAVASLRPRPRAASADPGQGRAGSPSSTAAPASGLRRPPRLMTAPPLRAPSLAARGGEAASVELDVSRPQGREIRVDAVSGGPAWREDRIDAALDAPSSMATPRGVREFAFAARPASPTPRVADEGAASSTDDRWPSLPPVATAPVPVAEAPPPRWSRLARDQEEGLWNA